MLEIYRDNLYIHCDTSTVPYQGSVNIPIRVIGINGEDLYSEYAIQPKVSYHDGTVWQSMLLPFEDGEFSLPTNVFAVNGIKKIALGLIKDDKEYVTNDLKIIVNGAPTGTLVLPLSPQWNELVDAYMSQRYELEYSQKFADLQKEGEAILAKFTYIVDNIDELVQERWDSMYTVLYAELEKASESFKELYNQATLEFSPITDRDINEMFIE